MRTTPFVLITFAALSFTVVDARADGSWCANFGTGHSGDNCSFKSMQECLATLSGLSGFCRPNPFPGTGYGRGGDRAPPPCPTGGFRHCRTFILDSILPGEISLSARILKTAGISAE